MTTPQNSGKRTSNMFIKYEIKINVHLLPTITYIILTYLGELLDIYNDWRVRVTCFIKTKMLHRWKLNETKSLQKYFCLYAML